MIENLPALAGGAGISAVLVAVVTLLANRKVNSANAAETLIKAAMGQATNLERQLKVARRELSEERAYRRDRDELVTAHEKWDRLVVRTAERLNAPFTDPPPLWPDDDTPQPPT